MKLHLIAKLPRMEGVMVILLNYGVLTRLEVSRDKTIINKRVSQKYALLVIKFYTGTQSPL